MKQSRSTTVVRLIDVRTTIIFQQTTWRQADRHEPAIRTNKTRL
jgi:hypothetical protein